MVEMGFKDNELTATRKARNYSQKTQFLWVKRSNSPVSGRFLAAISAFSLRIGRLTTRAARANDERSTIILETCSEFCRFRNR
jgi:hypothetical protein